MFRFAMEGLKEKFKDAIYIWYPLQIIESSYLGTRELRNKHHGKGMAQALADECQKLI